MIIDTIIRLDSDILTALHAWRSPALDTFFATLTWLGSLWLLLPMSLVAALACRRPGLAALRQALSLPAALAAASLLTCILKRLCQRPRPDLFAPLTILPDDASFPSGHASQVTALAVAGCLLLSRSRRLRLMPPIFAVTAAVVISRPYLQVHWPSDAMAGALLGMLCALALRFTLFPGVPHEE